MLHAECFQLEVSTRTGTLCIISCGVELAIPMAEEIGEEALGKRLNLSVVVAHSGVVVLPCALDGVLDLLERLCKFREALIFLKRTMARDGAKQGLHSLLQALFGLCQRPWAGFERSASKSSLDTVEDLWLLKSGVSYGIHDSGNEFPAALQLRLDVKPCLAGSVAKVSDPAGRKRNPDRERYQKYNSGDEWIHGVSSRVILVRADFHANGRESV